MTSIKMKSGYWFNDAKPGHVAIITNGDVFHYWHLTQLDYPDIYQATSTPLEYGRFEPVHEKISQLTNETNYNVKMFAGARLGVLDKEGTKLYIYTDEQTDVSVMEWIDNSKFQQIVNDRDHIDTPR